MAINNLQEAFIDENLYSFEQNWKIDSSLFGEPFYDGNIIYYDNGLDMSACTYTLPYMSTMSPELMSYLISEVRNSNRRSIKIYGNSVDISRISTLDSCGSYYYNSDIEHQEYYTNIYIYRNKKDAVRSYRAAKNIGYSFRLIKLDFLSFNHINIIKNYINSTAYSVIDNIYFGLMPHLISREDILFGEVFMREKLIGFCIFHKFSHNKYMQLMSFKDKNIKYKYFDDFVLGEFCEKFLENSTLFLGAGNTKNLKQFKSKWGEQGLAGNISGKFEINNSVNKETNQSFDSHLGIWWKELVCLQLGDDLL